MPSAGITVERCTAIGERLAKLSSKDLVAIATRLEIMSVEEFDALTPKDRLVRMFERAWDEKKVERLELLSLGDNANRKQRRARK
jgi:hypothetical protein